MELYSLYLVLLGLWLPLPWPALRTKGALRLWLWLVVALGLAASLNEARLWFGPAEAIRIDILFGAPILAGGYLVTAVLLFTAGWRRLALALGAVLLVLFGGAAYLWWESEREHARFLEGRALVAQAGFRSREVYETHFGPFAPATDGLPVGHWRSDGDPLATRLILNAEGRLWLFRRLSEEESLDFTSATPLRREGAAWTAALKEVHRPDRQSPVRVEPQGEGRLTLSFRDRRTAFTRAPPPIDPAPGHESLSYLGSFGRVDCGPRRVESVQLWLWRHQGGLLAVGIARPFAKGQPVRFAKPMVLGAGAAEAGAWIFAWEGPRGASQARLTLAEGEAELVLSEGSSLERRLRLRKGGGALAGDMIDLAPRSDAEAWRHWFDVVPLGNSLTGAMPDC